MELVITTCEPVDIMGDGNALQVPDISLALVKRRINLLQEARDLVKKRALFKLEKIFIGQA